MTDRELIEQTIPMIEDVTNRLSGLSATRGFKFDGKKISDEAQEALLVLHGQLPDLHRALEETR